MTTCSIMEILTLSTMPSSDVPPLISVQAISKWPLKTA